MPSPSWVRNRLIAGTLLLFAGRLVLSLIRTGPVLVADEVGYLTNARTLVGEMAGQMDLAPFYRGGYSLLIAPIVGLVSDPGLSYHLVLAVNAALAAALFPLLYVLLSRFVGIAPQTAIWAAFVGALYPALTVLSQAALSENALFLLVCLWLIAWGGLLEARGSRNLVWAAALGASTGALWAVHTRMGVAVLLTVVLLAWLGVRRRLGAATVLAALAPIALSLVATHYLDAFLIDSNYGGRESDEASERLSALFEGHGLRTAAANLVGQAWYLVVASFGLVAAVGGEAIARARRAAREGGEGPPPVTAILLALVILLLLISAAAFPVRTRPDMLIYGRYAELVAPPLIAIGVAFLAVGGIRARLSRPLLAFALLTGVLVLIRATAADPEAANRWNVSALPFLTFRLGPGILVAAALVAAAGGWLLLRTSRRSPGAVAPLAAALFLAVAVYGAWNPVRSSQRSAYPSGWTSPEAVASEQRVDTVAYDLDAYDPLDLYPLQWFLPETSFCLFHGDRRVPPSRFVLGARSWNADHPGRRATALWRASGRDEVLWRLREPPVPPPRDAGGSARRRPSRCSAARAAGRVGEGGLGDAPRPGR